MVDAAVNSSQLLAFIKGAIEDVTYTDGSPQYFGSDSDAQQQWNGTYFEGPNPAATTSMWENCPAMGYGDPSVASFFFEDFFNWHSTQWTSTETEGGAGDAAIAVSSTADSASNGVLSITTDNADNDSVELQMLGEAWDLESLTAGKKIWFEARIKLSAATEVDALVGLCITDTDLIDGMSDGIYFHKDDGDTNWDFATEKNTTATEVAAAGTADTNWIKLGFYYDGAGTVTPYVNGAAGTASTTNIPEDEQLTVSICLQNGEGSATKTMYVDYVKVVQMR
jgi:hypothetical protein